MQNQGNRDTVILPIRIKIADAVRLDEAVSRSKLPRNKLGKKSRNAWVLRAIEQGMRPHRRKR